MKNIIKLIICIIIINQSHSLYANTYFFNDLPVKDSIKTDTKIKKAHFQVRPSLGLTFGKSTNNGVTNTSLQWLGTVNADFDLIGKKFDLSSSLFMTYGQVKAKGMPAEKLQDALIFSITPSFLVLKRPAIRLFLETTAETNMGKGTIDNQPTSFLDPLFLYQTLFLGQKHYSYQGKKNTSWELTYGLGYAFQETINNKFQIINNLNGNKADFESGFSGLVEFNINSPITESLSFVLNFKAMALSRDNLFQHFNTSRKTVLLRTGAFYKKIGIEYNYHFVFDPNISSTNIVDHSLMLTISL